MIDQLSLKQFRCLLALDDAGTFRRAAEICGISQPSLTVQIQNIERALKVQLVERDPHGVRFTPVGREVLDRIRLVMADIQGVVDLTSSAQHGLAGVIRLGAKPTVGPYLLPFIVRELRVRHPGLKLYIREAIPRDLQQELTRGVHDVILTQLPVPGANLSARRLFREPLYVAVARDHPLTQRDEVTAADLAGQPVLSLGPGYHLHDEVIALCKEFGATALRDYEGTSLDALRQMVGMNMGISFLPALYVRSELEKDSEVVVRRLSGVRINRSVGLVWRGTTPTSDSYDELAEIFRAVAKNSFSDLIVES